MRSEGSTGFSLCFSPLPQSAPFQQRLRIRIPPHKRSIQFRRVVTVTPSKNILSKSPPNFPAKHSVFPKLGKSVRVQHLCPLIGVITRAIANGTGKEMCKARHHRVLRRKRRRSKTLQRLTR